jgi:hypothetical protein
MNTIGALARAVLQVESEIAAKTTPDVGAS